MFSSQSNSQTSLSLSSRTLLIIAAGALLLAMPLALNVMNRIRAEQRMRLAVAQMSAQVKLNQEKLDRLADAATYANSDAYVEHWARVQQRWVKNGETPVISALDGQPLVPQPWWQQFLTP